LGLLDYQRIRLELYRFAGTMCLEKNFGFMRWEYVKELQYYCEELPFDYLYDSLRWSF